MAQETKAAQNAGIEQETQENVIRFPKPYLFEGTEYAELDMSGRAELTVRDAIEAQRAIMRTGEAVSTPVCETTTAFAREIAVKATGLPVEFFKLMPRAAMKKVRMAVFETLDTQEQTKDHVVTFETPYTYEGKSYEDVDLNGIAQLNAMAESEAEKRMMRAGFVITDTEFNTMHACILASLATGLPEEFFTGLPLRETMKLKNAVNDDFFE